MKGIYVMIRKLIKSIREYKKETILTPLSVTIEVISGMRVIKSFDLEDEEEKKFKKKSQEIFELFSKAEKILAYNSPTMQFAMYAAMILISWIGARLIVTTNMTELTTGELSSLITYSIQILFSIMMVTMVSVMITISMASGRRIVMILDEATSSIDTRTEKLVQDGMDKLMEGRTVFVIAHRLSTVRNSKAIIVLEHGTIIERGTHEQLLEEKGEYYQLYTGAFELE